MATTSASALWFLFTTVSINTAGHINTHTTKVLKFIKVNIFLGPEEAMLWPGESLSSTGKMFFSEEKIELCLAYTQPYLFLYIICTTDSINL